MSYKTYLTALSPSAYWPLDDATTPEDAIGSLDGTLESGAALGAAGPLPADASTCATFDGTDDRINVADHATIDLTTNWSVSMFFYGDAFNHAGGSNFPRILSKGSGSGVGYQFLVDHAAGPKFAVQTQGLSDATHQTASSITTGTWYHATITHDGSNVRIYLNGTLDYTGAATGSVTTNATALYLGQRGDAANRWDGRIAHVAIWNGTVLTGTQASNLYAARLQGTSAATHARFNKMRFGAARFGYFTPNVIVTIAGTDRTTKVLRQEPFRVTQNRNEEPDTAEFTIGRNPGFTPTAGQAVVVALGTTERKEFAGQITDVEHVRSNKTQYPRYRVSCTDWAKLFNRRSITEVFSSQSATDIATSIISGYTSGFTAEAVESGLPTIDEFPCINELPMAAMARLANLIGGAFYIDPNRRVHLWGSAGPSSVYAPTNPVALTDDLSTLKAFRPAYDFSQVRTRSIVEGKSAQTMVKIPAGADLGTYGIPLDDNGGWLFNPSTDSEANFARIGAMVVSYDHAEQAPGPPACLVSVDASPGDTSIEVSTLTNFDTAGWVHDGDGHYAAYRSSDLVAPFNLLSIPSSGYGSIPIEWPAGTPLYQCHHLETVASVAPSSDVERDVDIGEPVVVRAHVNDTAAQTAIAAIEGGDGIHEHVIEDGDLTYAGCVERASAELDVFSAALVRAGWVTHDMNARPGTRQVVSLAAPDLLNTELTIDSATLEFPINNYPPRRTCEGSTVKLATVLDAIGN